MMKMSGLAVAVLLAPVAIAPVSAQEGAFQIERTEGGYVRMDTRTGRIWFCREETTGIVCDPATETEATPDAELRDLEQRIEALERRLADLSPAPAAELPSEDEFERSLSMMERFMKRFMGIVRDMEEEPDPARI